MIEPVRLILPESRKAQLKEAGYNLFVVKAENIVIDKLTDYGADATSRE